MRASLLICFTSLMSIAASGQTKTATLKDRSVIYFSAGTERIFYTPSTIHFKSDKGQPSFDFSLKKAKAHDDGGLSFTDDAPQYSYNFGYYSPKKKFGIEFQFDHVKYIMHSNQNLHIKGSINGRSLDKDTLVSPDFVQFEHTDGANYSMLSFVKWKTLAESRNQKSFLNLIMKAGAGPLIPKTNSTIMGVHYDDEYAVSGYVIGLESGLRYNVLKYLFATASFKAAYANYTHFVIANGHGHQQWVSGQFDLMVGIQMPL
jgi:hypothetical protein